MCNLKIDIRNSKLLILIKVSKEKNLISSLTFISLHASHQFIYLDALYIQSICNLKFDIRHLKISILIKVSKELRFAIIEWHLFDSTKACFYTQTIYVLKFIPKCTYISCLWFCKKDHQKLESRWLILR